MSSDPVAYLPTAMTAAGGSSLDSIMPMLQMAKGGWDMLSAARRGSISQGLGGALNMYGGYQGMQGKPKGLPDAAPSNAPWANDNSGPYVPPSESPTTQSKFGMTRDEFMQLDPELRQRMLQQLMGR